MTNSRYFKKWVCIIFVFSFSVTVLLAGAVKTPAEETNFTQYSQHEEVSRFLSRLDQLSKELEIRIIGQTLEVRDYPSRDLYLCIITEEGADCAQQLNREKPSLLIVASQHGNEQSAKEAALWMIRDLAVGEMKSLLKKVNFLVIPQANPYGNWRDQRRNEQDLDLNRDHVKLESPEVMAIHRVFRSWMPEVTLDIHEKGDDFYRVSIGCVSNVNIHPRLQEISRNTILNEIEKKLRKKNITFHEYLVTQRMGIDSSAGVRYREEDLGERQTMKRYSTTDLNDGRNSLGIYETLSFIQEGASRHDVETLRERTRWQYFGIRFLAESIAQHGDEIVSMVRGLREDLMERARAFSPEHLVHLRMKYARSEKVPELTIERFERPESPVRGILKVDKKAGEPLFLADLETYPYPSTLTVVKEVEQNWFPLVEPVLSVPRPVGYIIPAKHQDVVETLLRHGLEVDMFTKDTSFEVEVYQVGNVIPAEYDYLPPQEIEVEKKSLKTIVKREDFYVSCAQTGANLIPCLLEPESQYGLIRYWKFDLVPEAGDIFSFFRYTGKKDLPVVPYKKWKR
ncbi:MAG: DUF2817 domain-containing protein [Candidatus Aminicenantes bacterium]|nr:MAG: DUF2817 domain-containing protein [Candidatus Aminicenantes bacterium]